MFKLLVGDRSPTFQHCSWDLPKQVGGQWVPGAWMPSVEPDLGVSGYHLTDDPVRWWGVVHRDVDQRVYLVQTRGKSEAGIAGASLDVAVESARLLRPLTDEELADLNVIHSGTHGREAPMGLAVVTGGVLHCVDVGTVRIYNHGEIDLKGHISGCVNLFQHSRAAIRGSGVVYAMGERS